MPLAERSNHTFDFVTAEREEREEALTVLKDFRWSLLTSAATSGKPMSVAFFRRFFDAAQPPFQQQRPKGHRAGNNQETKSPTAVRRVRVNPADADKCEWNRHNEAASQVDSNKDEKRGGDHDGTAAGIGALRRPRRVERRNMRHHWPPGCVRFPPLDAGGDIAAQCSDFNSALSE